MVHARRPSAMHGPAVERPFWSRVLRALREARGITQDGWAGQLGYGRATIKRWEAGQAVPSAEAEALLIALCGEKQLFRTYELGPLRGVLVTPEFLRDLLAEARMGGALTPAEELHGDTAPAGGSGRTDLPRNNVLGRVEAPEAVQSRRPATATEGESPAERRQLTVMVCGLVDFPQLSTRLDPEDLDELVQALHAAWMAEIDRFGGSVAATLSDRLLVYFGYPLAHEDDARRAVHAALGILSATTGLSGGPQGELQQPLSARIGVHTGLVVAGEQRGAGSVVGGTTEIAAALQEGALPDTVVIGAATRRLVEGYFACRELDAGTPPGLGEPVTRYQVLRATGVRGRLQLAGLTRLVGREQELALLRDRWQRAAAGSGPVVALAGEPGIGKSRLLHALKEEIAGRPHTLIECQCSPYHQSSALYPLITALQQLLGFEAGDSMERKLSKLAGLLSSRDLSPSETVPLFAALLSLPLVAPYTPSEQLPEQQRRKTLEALLRLLLHMAEQQPLLFVVEDLHWCDASTLELLELVVDQAPAARICALFTARPEFTPAWPLRSYLSQVTLGRLPEDQAAMLIERVAGGKLLPEIVVRQVALRSDGIPLFMEELTRAVLESGVLKDGDGRYELQGKLFSLLIPITLQDSLMARLDRLGGAKEVAQWGAALGREFSYALLRAVCPQEEEALQRGLSRLVGAELLYPRGVPPRATYLFKHALIQEAAYESVLRRRRQQYHQRIATVLVEQFPEVAERQPELVAHHFTEAGLIEQAVAGWQRAGRRAIERSANAEALVHLRKGLELLRRLPEGPERLRQELELQTALGLVLMPVSGYGSAEVEAVFRRALQLCREVGETLHLFSVLRGLWEFHDLRADTRASLALGGELLRLATAAGDAGLLVIAHQVLGETLIWPGEFVHARAHLDQAIAGYDPRAHRNLAFRHGGYDAGVVCRTWLAHVLWYLGYPDQALGRCEEALALARDLANPHTLTFALSHAAVLHSHRGEAEAARPRAEEAIALATRNGFEFWAAFASIPRGWALAESERDPAGIAEIHAGIAGYRSSGAEVERPLWLALLARACSAAGRFQEALAAVDEGLAVVDSYGLSFYRSELQRLRGEMLLMLPGSGARHAEACFLQALGIARGQQAAALELRAATSLGRLWLRQGKHDETRQMLSEVRGRFSEGFETADLRAMQALLCAT